MKKKLFSIILSVSMVIGLTACGTTSGTSSDDGNTKVSADLFDTTQYKSEKNLRNIQSPW